MHCSNCGHELGTNASFCTACGCMRGVGTAFCWNCAAGRGPASAICTSCGADLRTGHIPSAPGFVQSGGKSKVLAGILGILFGGLGVHRFYLGYTTLGIIQIVVSICTFGFGALWGFVEGILILAGQIKTDAAGNALSD